MGGILVYVRNGIPAKDLNDHNLPDDIECGFVEINMKEKKWLLEKIYTVLLLMEKDNLSKN